MFEKNLQVQQTTNIVMITFWSQFATYSLNTILVLFLTKPLLEHGLGYGQAAAYAFIGVSQATGYLMPIFGGYMADQVLGIRRSILIGSIMLAIGFLLVMLSGHTITKYGDTLFLAAYALIPASNSFLVSAAIAFPIKVKVKTDNGPYLLSKSSGAIIAASKAPTLIAM